MRAPKLRADRSAVAAAAQERHLDARPSGHERLAASIRSVTVADEACGRPRAERGRDVSTLIELELLPIGVRWRAITTALRHDYAGPSIGSR